MAEPVRARRLTDQEGRRLLQDYLRWRNAHARHPGVLAAQRRERARLRSERQQRWGRPKPKAALPSR
jgi:hypothetical protein